MRTRCRDKEKKKKSRRSGYDDMHLAPPHHSSSWVLHRCRVAKWEESPEHLNLPAPPPPDPPGNISTALPGPRSIFVSFSSRQPGTILDIFVAA